MKLLYAEQSAHWTANKGNTFLFFLQLTEICLHHHRLKTFKVQKSDIKFSPRQIFTYSSITKILILNRFFFCLC